MHYYWRKENGKMMRKTRDGKIRFEKEYWRLGDNGQVHYFSTLGDYSESELVKRLNKLERNFQQYGCIITVQGQ